MFGANINLVATFHVLSFALVTSDSFPAESTCGCFWSAPCELCMFFWHSVELCSCCCRAQRVLSRRSGACFSHPCCRDSSSSARDCVFLTRHGLLLGSRNLMCPPDPAWLCLPEFTHGSTVDSVGRPSETDGGSVGCGTTCSSDWKPQTFSGDVDVNGQAEGCPGPSGFSFPGVTSVRSARRQPGCCIR